MKRFRYSLDPVIKQYEWEIDALKLELTTLNQALDAKLAELQQLKDAVRAAEQSLLEMCQENAVIALDRKALIELYLRDQLRLTEEKEQEIVQARSLVDTAFLQLTKKKQSQRGIEKHRERKRKDFDAEGMRQESLEADELWLSKIVAAR
jgi:flagellar biosynthesis chaperone FliJ